MDQIQSLALQIQQSQIVTRAIETAFSPAFGPFKVWHVAAFAVYLLLKLLQQNKPKDTCTASHILVKTEAEALELKASKESFEDLAKAHSSCPSKNNGGSLGSFSRGNMVPEFDKICFDPQQPLNKVLGPIKTQFGYHLVKITKRSFVDAKKTQ
jgi:peptidyl-prolyl cis-trans isomerase C